MKTLYPFQEIGRDFLYERRRAILADDMGLGKTIQVIEGAKKTEIKKGIILCPLSVRRTWTKVLRDQYPSIFIKEIISPKTQPDPMAFNVINYDLVWREPLIKELHKYQWPLLVLDECHKLKNIESKRAKAVLGRFGLYNKCERVWAMSGTPVLNRPVELYALLRSLCPELLGLYTDFYRYAYHFCGGYQDTFGFNTSGDTHLDELSKMLSAVMLRRLKEEVLTDLPEITYEKVYLDPTDKLLAVTKKEKAAQDQKIGDTSSLRRMLGVLKAAAIIEHIEDMIEQRDKMVVFTWHHEVVDILKEHFGTRAVEYTGRQTINEKEKAKDDFTSRSEVKLFIGNIDAAGTAVDGLQNVCDVCLFVELSHVPGIIKQAIDRIRRIGQARPVLAQFAIVEDSMDEEFVDSLTTKSKNINTIMQERGDINFIGVRCSVCGMSKEMKEIRRAAGLPVCAKCEKLMGSIL